MTAKINFVFDGNLTKLINREGFLPTEIGNFLSTNLKLPGDAGYRFQFPPSIKSVFEIPNQYMHPVAVSIKNPPEKYIVATGVGTGPHQWAGGYYGENGKVPTIFDVLRLPTLRDIQNRRALYLLDQSYEGYHEKWVWDFFHKGCSSSQIDPRALVYITGNLNAPTEYNEWCLSNNIENRIKVIADITLGSLIVDAAKGYKPSFQTIFDHKKENYSDIKLFDCINKRDRTHRIINFILMVQRGLVDDGLISMDTDLTHHPVELKKYGIDLKYISLAKELLPTWIDGIPNNTEEYHVYANRILADVYKRTWVSVVTEASYFSNEDTIFISEKTLKPIVCMQPFLIVGSKGSLSKLREKGYRTFHPYIDESYDLLDDTERFNAVLDSIGKIKNIDDKLSWLTSMKEILEHNYNHFWNTVGVSISKELSEYYLEYFGE